jgi:hypothetical protein
MDYQAKYLKYKKKYFDLKQESKIQNGGNNSDEMSRLLNSVFGNNWIFGGNDALSIYYNYAKPNTKKYLKDTYNINDKTFVDNFNTKIFTNLNLESLKNIGDIIFVRKSIINDESKKPLFEEFVYRNLDKEIVVIIPKDSELNYYQVLSYKLISLDIYINYLLAKNPIYLPNTESVILDLITNNEKRINFLYDFKLQKLDYSSSSSSSSSSSASAISSGSASAALGKSSSSLSSSSASAISKISMIEEIINEVCEYYSINSDKIENKDQFCEYARLYLHNAEIILQNLYNEALNRTIIIDGTRYINIISYASGKSTMEAILVKYIRRMHPKIKISITLIDIMFQKTNINYENLKNYLTGLFGPEILIFMNPFDDKENHNFFEKYSILISHQPQIFSFKGKENFYNYLDVSKYNLEKIVDNLKTDEVTKIYARQFGYVSNSDLEIYINEQKLPNFRFLGEMGKFLNNITEKEITKSMIIFTDGKNRSENFTLHDFINRFLSK